MWLYRLNTNSKCTDITMACDCTGFNTCTVVHVICKTFTSYIGYIFGFILVHELLCYYMVYYDITR